MSIATARRVVTPTTVTQLLLGWGTYTLLWFLGDLGPLSTGPLVILLAALVGIIAGCAFGVVTQAEAIAKRLPDPYGTLVLTLSIVVIEVVLIAAVMLGPGQHPNIARDSVMAVSMIILNLVIGLALLIAGLRHTGPRFNPVGTTSYLTLLVVLLSIAFVVPGMIGTDGSYTTGQAALILTLTILLYAFFLVRQIGAQRTDFQEPQTTEHPAQSVGDTSPGVGRVVAHHRRELTARSTLLIALVIPIVLLSHVMAGLLDDAMARLGAPTALAGIIIAVIVFLPETVTALRAAYRNELQRVSNLCHGAAVSTVGLTIPVVLTIGLITSQDVILAENPTNLALLGITLVLTAVTALTPKVTALHGAGHLAVFVLYILTVFI
ncbi:calcium:proton antiporter [Enteractinococcus fodinae]|uniref:Ca2+:H+ antiporter n=1 Tax=Enteractinococcus fodinae TaxID=684663 RepID=A0ABU2B0A4_9MICC|nr:calcium:proton antiporter [Enteractinococcus fodinae]MDR7347031.1 Ca2+:H+ antiporter [Enteractinococcus fodinae]